MLNQSLAGGYIESYKFELEEKRIMLRIDVLENGRLSSYDVVFRGVSHFSFDDERVSSWERIELTDLSIDAAPEGSSSEEWLIDLNLWDTAHLTVRCATISINDELLK